jgi:hypothetical protein
MTEVISKLAMTEEEARNDKSGMGKVQILGHWYKATDIEDITWVDADGTDSSGVDYPEYASSYYGDAEILYVVLSDGTQLEVDVTDKDTELEMLYEWIDTM